MRARTSCWAAGVGAPPVKRDIACAQSFRVFIWSVDWNGGRAGGCACILKKNPARADPKVRRVMPCTIPLVWFTAISVTSEHLIGSVFREVNEEGTIACSEKEKGESSNLTFDCLQDSVTARPGSARRQGTRRQETMRVTRFFIKPDH